MTGEILKLNDFLTRYGIRNEYKGGIACIAINSHMLNQCELSDEFIDAYSMMIPLKGYFNVSVNYMECKIKSGNLLLLAPHLIVSHISHSNDFEALQLFVENGVFERLMAREGHYERMDTLNEARPVIPLSRHQQEHMIALLNYIIMVIKSPHIHKDIIVPDLVHVAQFIVLENILGANVELRDHRHTDKIFSRFVFLAMEHFRNEHKIGFYANQLNITDTYLSRIVKEKSHQTVKNYLSALIRAEASRLLRVTDLSISEIAGQLHFNDLSAFGKFFKQHYGISPQTYRQQNETMKNGITHATMDDLHAITLIENECFPPAEAASETTFFHRLTTYPEYFWLSWEEGQLVGFVDGLLTDQEDLTDPMFSKTEIHNPNGKWLMVLGVCTAPSHQHQGIASELIHRVVADVKKQRREGIVLTCKRQLINFYAQFGFKNEGISQSIHGDALWYQMRLRLR